MKNPLHNFNIAVSNVKGLAKLSETTPFTIKSLVLDYKCCLAHCCKGFYD